jgi:hypothetical protein
MTTLQAQALTKIYGSGAPAVTALDHISLTTNPMNSSPLWSPVDAANPPYSTCLADWINLLKAKSSSKVHPLMKCPTTN